MKTILKHLSCLLVLAFACAGCIENPVDEDGLLITGRDECYVSNFFLLGTDGLTVLLDEETEIDNEACVIRAIVKYGTDLRNVKPQFSLVTDAKLDPKIVGLTDFSDLDNPRSYTVISGSRNVKKTYTILLQVLSRN